jgi:hypothetical protein
MSYYFVLGAKASLSDARDTVSCELTRLEPEQHGSEVTAAGASAL